MKRNYGYRILSLVLALFILVGQLPAISYAAETKPNARVDYKFYLRAYPGEDSMMENDYMDTVADSVETFVANK